MLITKFIVAAPFDFFSNARSYLFFVFSFPIPDPSGLVFHFIHSLFSNARSDNYHSRKFLYSYISYIRCKTE